MLWMIRRLWVCLYAVWPMPSCIFINESWKKKKYSSIFFLHLRDCFPFTEIKYGILSLLYHSLNEIVSLYKVLTKRLSPFCEVWRRGGGGRFLTRRASPPFSSDQTNISISQNTQPMPVVSIETAWKTADTPRIVFFTKTVGDVTWHRVNRLHPKTKSILFPIFFFLVFPWTYSLIPEEIPCCILGRRT